MTGHPNTCAMPTCPDTATVHNKAGQGTCTYHQPVVVTASWMDNTRKTDGGHG